FQRALEVHRAAFAQPAGHLDHGAAGARPDVAPLSSAWNEKAEAGSGRAADPLPLLEDRAAAVALSDGVVADQRAVDAADLPAAEPEVELRRLRHPEARVHPGAHVADDALKARIVAQRLELRAPFDDLARPRADVIGRLEGGERLAVAAERDEVQRALDLDHRFRRLRGERRI